MLAERESEALWRIAAEAPRLVSSLIAAVEVPLAVRRATESEAAASRADEVLSRLSLLAFDPDIARVAATLVPLRTLAAVHLATALSLGRELEAFLAYDRRLAETAGAAGIAVLAPQPGSTGRRDRRGPAGAVSGAFPCRGAGRVPAGGAGT